MRKFFAKVETEARRHAEFRRLRDEIAGLSWREQLDIGISPDQAEAIARQTIYG